MMMTVMMMVTVSFLSLASLCLIEQYKEIPVHCLVSDLARFRPIVNTYSMELQSTPPCHDLAG